MLNLAIKLQFRPYSKNAYRFSIVTLGMKDLAVLSRKLHPIASQWYSLGIQLEFEPGELRIIHQRSSLEPTISFIGLLEQWLNRTDPPSNLEAMINVIGGEIIANGKLCKKLQDECGDFPSIKSKSKQPGIVVIYIL